MVRAVAILAGLLVVLVGPLGGEPPPMVDTTDPLQLAKPVLSRPLSPRRSPAGRISFGGGMPALPDAGSRIRVVVLLGGDETGADQGDAELDRVRWLEHEFVSRASAVGFVPLRGLSHFPVVIGEADAGVIRRLAQDPWVVSIAPDIPLAPARVEGGALVRVPRMRLDTGFSGEGVGVAVVDSGVDSLHPELEGQVVFSRDYTGSGNPSDSDGHGTSVAGIIAGRAGGLAPGVRIWNARVMPGTLATLLAGLNDLYANRFAFGGLDVINVSIASPEVHSDATCDGIDAATTKIIESFDAAGILVFASSGNEGKRSGVSFPACVSKIVAVGAVYDADLGRPMTYTGAGCSEPTPLVDQVPCYSNAGRSLDLLAPSDCARAPSLGGSYEECFNGTSAASPYAAGVAALLIGAVPGATPAEVRDTMAATGKPVIVGGSSWNRVDAMAAYSALAGEQCLARVGAIACNSTGSGQLEDPDCETADPVTHELWNLDVERGNTITAIVASTDLAPEIILVRPDLTVAARSGAANRVTFTVDVPGEWWIEVRRTSADVRRSGTYDLTVVCEPSPRPPRRRPVRP